MCRNKVCRNARCILFLRNKEGGAYFDTPPSYLLVELEGIEPSSKRGNNKLSTCLSLPKFSCASRTKAIN